MEKKKAELIYTIIVAVVVGVPAAVFLVKYAGKERPTILHVQNQDYVAWLNPFECDTLGCKTHTVIESLDNIDKIGKAIQICDIATEEYPDGDGKPNKIVFNDPNGLERYTLKNLCWIHTRLWVMKLAEQTIAEEADAHKLLSTPLLLNNA